MKLQEYRALMRDNYDWKLPEKIGRGLTLEDAEELARETSRRPTVNHSEDERVLWTLAAALAAAVESHKR